MQQTERTVLLAEAQQSRRLALRAIAAVTGGALFFGATQTGLRSSDSTLAMDDDADNSGHGSSNSGSGHGGDDDEDGAVGPQAQVPPGSIEIRIVSDDADGFSPNELTVDLGQAVTFVNTHHDEHTATGSGFDTGIIPEGGIATVVMNEPGVFPYACQIHPVMTGQISVRDENGVVPQPQTASASPTADATQVQIANLAFNPTSITVSTGNTVTWTNDDTLPHTVTAQDDLFDSGILDPGATFAWTFTDPGSIAYHCQLHPNMQGTVVVEGSPVAGNTSNATTPEATPAPAATAAPAASATSAGVEPSVWIADFAPDDSTTLSPQRALLSLHADGLLRADFAAIGASASADSRLTAGQGTWQQNGDRIELALVALIVDRAGQYGGMLTIAASGQGDTASGASAGTWTYTLTDPNDSVVGQGQGFWQGAPAPLDLAAPAG
jgi:plastocyanin